MSARHGKVKIDGIPEINGKKYIAMFFIQGRSSDWIKKPIFAEYNENACWIDELKPAFGGNAFFFEDEDSGFKGIDDFNAEADIRSGNDYAFCLIGRCRVKVLPFPSSLSTDTLPP